MFNCYVIIWCGRPFCYLKTELACENMIRLLSIGSSPIPKYTIEGRFIPGIEF